jgi:hypothetical protein
MEPIANESRSSVSHPDLRLPVLRLLGTAQGERRIVQWCERSAALTPKCFKFLAKLAVSRAVEPQRWVLRDELERGENQARYLYRLKGEIEAQCGALPALWENNRRGGYRLTVPPDRIVVSWQALENYDDYDLVAWVKSFRPPERRVAEVRPGAMPVALPAP